MDNICNKHSGIEERIKSLEKDRTILRNIDIRLSRIERYFFGAVCFAFGSGAVGGAGVVKLFGG